MSSPDNISLLSLTSEGDSGESEVSDSAASNDSLQQFIASSTCTDDDENYGSDVSTTASDRTLGTTDTSETVASAEEEEEEQELAPAVRARIARVSDKAWLCCMMRRLK